MRLIISGGRDFEPHSIHSQWLDELHAARPITQVVCGMAPGADTFGRHWGLDHDIPVAEFPADWTTFGKSAGPRRNRQMAAAADAVVLFPGGIGTANMAAEARKVDLRIYDWRNRPVK